MKTPDEIAKKCIDCMNEVIAMKMDAYEYEVRFTESFLEPLTDALRVARQDAIEFERELTEAREENERLRNYLGAIGGGAYIIGGKYIDVPLDVAKFARSALDESDN